MEIKGLTLEHTLLGSRCSEGSWNIGICNELAPFFPLPHFLPLLPSLSLSFSLLLPPNESLNLCPPGISICHLFPLLTLYFHVFLLGFLSLFAHQLFL